MHNAEEEPRLFDAILAYDDDILSAWGPFYHKILIDIVEEEHVHKSDFFNVQDVGKMWKKFWKTWYSAEKRMMLSSQYKRLNWNLRMCITELLYSLQP